MRTLANLILVGTLLASGAAVTVSITSTPFYACFGIGCGGAPPW